MLILACLILLAAGLAILFFLPATTSPITDAGGKPLPGSIASLETICLGGVEQSILIRGESTANPVLLFLHGGPGTSELGLVRQYNMSALEKHFIVVVWDQRGAGKSYRSINPPSAMTIDQFIADTHELTLELCRRFGKEKICLVGHSWGSALGVLTAAKYPENYFAYVGIGQVVNMMESERISYCWTLAQAEKAGDRKAVRKLKAMGEPPYSGDWRSKVIYQRSRLGKYGGEVYGNSKGGSFILLGSLLKTKEYTWRDRINLFRGIFGTMKLMWPQLMSIDLAKQAPELCMPVFFLEGRHDYESPSVLAEGYFDALTAPCKKLVWFERSAHFVNTEEAEKFNDVLIREVRPLGVCPPGEVYRMKMTEENE